MTKNTETTKALKTLHQTYLEGAISRSEWISRLTALHPVPCSCRFCQEGR